MNAKESDLAEFTIIYGRQRVGKTELLKQILDHDAIYFLGRLESPSDQLRRLSQLVTEKLKDEKVGKFPSETGKFTMNEDRNFEEWLGNEEVTKYNETTAETRKPSKP